ncbi:MAG: helix-turn-helix transcriptional regulator [Ruminococcaceae bacterium]|nr:helix-turn-helix transcriptional regulator [Oscillospiraceae bacterium]
MTDERLKIQIGTNISNLRKRQGLTQAGLAEKVNYSDKAVSKWERGESVPDILTLVSLAEVLGVTVDDLLQDPDALPEHTGAVQQAMDHVVQKTLKRKANKRIIVYLSSLLVWFVALFMYVVLSSAGIAKSWLAFFFAVPADAIVVLSLRSAWRDFRSNQTLISVIVWGCLLSVYMTLLVLWNVNVWRIFLLGIPGQLAIFLWFRMFRPVVGKEVKNEQESTETENP